MTDSSSSSLRIVPAEAPASGPSSETVNSTSHGDQSGFAGRNGPTIFEASLIMPLEPTSLRDVVTEDSIKDLLQRLIRLRSDAVYVADILDHAFWPCNREIVDARGALVSHQPCAMVEEIDATISQVVQQEYPQIPKTLHRLDGPPEIIPRVDEMALRTPRSPALVSAMELVDDTSPDDLGSEKLRTVLEGLSSHERVSFAHYLRNYGYASLVYQGEWDARLYFRMLLEGRSVDIVLLYADPQAPWPVFP